MAIAPGAQWLGCRLDDGNVDRVAGRTRPARVADDNALMFEEGRDNTRPDGRRKASWADEYCDIREATVSSR
jgi:hypothetical protein